MASLLVEQGYACAYCALPFGTVISTRGRLTCLSCQFDHFTPYAYVNGNPDDNWVASCHVCNRIKSNHKFTSVMAARIYILGVWDKRQSRVEWLAPVSCEENPSRWAVKFATYLAGLPRGLAQHVAWPRVQTR